MDARVYETKKRIGEPNHCTGLVSKRLLDIVKPDNVLRRINGALFVAGSEKAFLKKPGAAVVIDRPEFDRQLARMAEAEGAEISTGMAANWKELKGTVLAADGVLSRTRHDLGQKIGFLPALQFDLKEKLDQDYVELWYGPWAPEFFAWVVPLDTGVRVGLAAKDVRGLKGFVLKRFGRFRPEQSYAGLVITSGPVKKSYFRFRDKEVLLVGDAAGQVKPTTGGGVVMGMAGAELAADALAKGKPADYEKEWKKTLGRELALQKLAMSLIKKEPEAFVRFLDRVAPVLESEGDMDFQSSVALKLLPEAVRWLFDSLI